MGIGTALHNKTRELCQSLRWKEWAGYFAVESYGVCHLPEYYAIREQAGIMDISPLYKYEIKGKDASLFMNYVLAKDVTKIKPKQVSYCVWCDEEGKVIDDGTVFCFSSEHYRVTAANPALRWFQENSPGFEVEIEDVSEEIAAISLQGPKSRDILKRITSAPLDELKYFWFTEDKLAQVDVLISRTGYTGDLGYEIWMKVEEAEKCWDKIMEAGKDYGLRPVGLMALDMARVEAGFILIDVDFYSSKHTMTESQKSFPQEISLGWTVSLKKPHFVGKKAIQEQKRQGFKYQLVGIEIDWDDLERAYEEVGLPPSLPHSAWRCMVPIHHKNRQVGYASSGCWSPNLKKYIALATLEAPYAKIGTDLTMEETIEFSRKKIKAKVVKKPFFNPARKTS